MKSAERSSAENEGEESILEVRKVRRAYNSHFE
jgi:hypothetical protein